jgi:iron complex outermembrane receptor protein
MSFQLKPIVLSVAATFGGAAVLAGLPTPAAAQQSLDRVEITGSNIRRTDTETVAPVEIITREQISRSGKATVAEVLRAMPANTGGSFSESFSNSFAPGASGVSLRGLGQKTTLVLLNGRRVAGYGFAQNLQDTFVDLNTIPTSAVERIEVLKDGASAIYGSDAIAGVVNVILRRDFKGVEVAGDYGWFDGANDWRANVSAGFGDLATQKFNVFGVLDYYKRDELKLSETDFGRNRDYRDRADGGRNFQSLTAGGTWSNVTGVGANGRPIIGTQRRAISDCAQHGRVVDFQGAVNAGLLNPAIAANAALNQPGNTWCVVDFNSGLSALPGTERIGFLGRGTVELTPRTQLYAEAAYSRVETEQGFTPPFFANTVGLTPTPAGLRPYTYNVTFAPGIAGNPFASDAQFAGNLSGLGNRNIEIQSDTWRGLLGAKYGFGNWELDSAGGYSKNEVDQSNINRLALNGVASTFNIPTTPQPPQPRSTASTCNLDTQYSSPGCSAMLITFPRKSTSELYFVDTKASTELGELPGGAAGLAVGIEYRHEKIADVPDPIAQSGGILGQGVTQTEGQRHNTAGYIEFALPLTKQIEAQVAARDDYYSDFGNAFTPKVGLKIKPSNEVVIRANWGRGFRAPSLPEISDSVATFFVQVNDALTGLNGVQVSGVFAGNPNLKPEKSRTGNVGIVIAPTADFSVSLDYYDIAWTDIVGSDTFQSIIDNDSNSRLAGGAGDPRVIRDPGIIINGPNGPQPQVVTILSNFRNLTRTETRGVDFDIRGAMRTSFGRFSARLNAAYIIEFTEDGEDFAGTNGGTNTYPRLKGNLGLAYETGPVFAQLTVNYIHRYEQQLLAASFFAPGCEHLSPCPAGTTYGQTGSYPTKVPSYTSLDLFGSWQVTPALQLNASIVNLTNEMPPYDPGFDATNNYDFTQYDIRGRTYRVGVKYRFF